MTNSTPSFDVSLKRQLLAGPLHLSGISALLAQRINKRYHGRYIRAINYHQTPPRYARNFESHLRYYQRRFAPVTPEDLTALLERGRWPHDRPGLLISFDDGVKSNYDVAAPLLAQYGFIGWFFVPSGFIDCPPQDQRSFARAHDIYGGLTELPSSDGRVAMNWDELRDLKRRGHVVGCHTHSHVRLGGTLSTDQMRYEIVDAKRLMEERLASPVESFCWVGGEEHAYSAQAAQLIASAGYRFGFMTNSDPITSHSHRLQLNRTNIEERFPLSLMTFQLSGLPDWKFAAKRERVNHMTRV